MLALALGRVGSLPRASRFRGPHSLYLVLVFDCHWLVTGCNAETNQNASQYLLITIIDQMNQFNSVLEVSLLFLVTKLDKIYKFRMWCEFLSMHDLKLYMCCIHNELYHLYSTAFRFDIQYWAFWAYELAFVTSQSKDMWVGVTETKFFIWELNQSYS